MVDMVQVDRLLLGVGWLEVLERVTVLVAAAARVMLLEVMEAQAMYRLPTGVLTNGYRRII
jgi:hypothetical protein